MTLNDDSVTASERGEVQMTIKAAKDAPVGDHVIRVTGTPDAGSATTLDVKVTVKEKS